MMLWMSAAFIDVVLLLMDELSLELARQEIPGYLFKKDWAVFLQSFASASVVMYLQRITTVL